MGKTLDCVSCFPLHFFRALPLLACFTTEQCTVEAYLFVNHPSGIPETPDIIDVPGEIHSDEVALKWSKPNSNGADITQYTVYIRDVNSNGTVGDWRKLEVIFDVFAREYVITLKNGQQYDLLVTATNQYGESLKEQHNIKRIRVLGGIITKKKLFDFNKMSSIVQQIH